MSAMSAVDHHSAKLNGIAPGWRHAGHPGKPTAADLSLVGKKEHVIKAIAIDDFGVPPSLHDLPVPEPGEGEVLVRVRTSSVNGFANVQSRYGYPRCGLAPQDGHKTRPRRDPR
jgi:hypothetical protein